jgi:hypothetical protein
MKIIAVSKYKQTSTRIEQPLRRTVVSRESRGPTSSSSTGWTTGKRHKTLDSIEKEIAQRWSQWNTHRYRRIDDSQGVVVAVPSPDEASEILWDVIQAEKAFRTNSTLGPSLYTKALVKGCVNAMGLSNDGVHVNTTLSLGLVPRTMLSLAYAGGSSVWDKEMDALCSMVTRVDIQSLRQVDDCLRGMKISRHYMYDRDALEYLDRKAGEYLQNKATQDPDKDVNIVGSILQGMVYQRYIPMHLLSSICIKLSQWRLNRVRTVARLGNGVALAACLMDDDNGRDVSVIQTSPGIVREIAKYLIENLQLIHIERKNDSGGELNMFEQTDLAALHTFLLWYTGSKDSLLLSDKNSIIIASLLEQSIQARHDHIFVKKKHTISAFQREMYDILRLTLGISCSMEDIMPNGISVDISIPRLKIALEADGVSHFYRNVPLETLNGSHAPAFVYKRAMMKICCPEWRLYSVPWVAWDSLPNKQAKCDYLMNVIKE